MMVENATDVVAGEGQMLLCRARWLWEPAMRESVDGLPEPLRGMARYHCGWCDANGSAVREGSGKGLRAALVFAAARAVGARAAVVTPAAVAIELLHNFTLIHDDVMDGDQMRRGRPAVWSAWGMSEAICLGDALHAAAIRVLTDGLPNPLAARAVARLASTAVEICQGQCDDLAFETRDTITVDDYVAMATSKTAELMGCACVLGAECAAADPETVTALEVFGRQVGVAFQIADDVLGIWGDPAVTGKPVGADLVRRKQSLPVVIALNENTAAASELARLYRSRTPISPQTAAHAASLVAAAGGREGALQYADHCLRIALAALPPDLPLPADLSTLADLARLRNR